MRSEFTPGEKPTVFSLAELHEKGSCGASDSSLPGRPRCTTLRGK